MRMNSFDALIKGNRFECQNVMKEFRKQNLSIVLLYEEIFKKSLYRVGLMWEYNKVGVAVSTYGNFYCRRFNE